LRHTFISRAVALGDPMTIRSLVGHADFRTTLKYTHPDQANKRKITAKIGTILRSLIPND
jgi:integrase